MTSILHLVPTFGKNMWLTISSWIQYTWKNKQETYTAKVFIQQLHVSVDDLQCDELVVLVLYGTAEVKAGISATQWQKSNISQKWEINP